MLTVDDRWIGPHGIGRFSSEVIPRLTTNWRPLTAIGQPWSTFDALNASRLRLSARDWIYSPGYNAGMLTRARQILTIHDLIHLEGKGKKSRLKRQYYDRVVRPAANRARLVITVSETSRIKIREWLSSERIQVVNVGNAVSEKFHWRDTTLPRHSDYFVFVGNTKPHKNLAVVLRAITKRPSYQLRLVLPTSDVGLARFLVRSHKAERQVSILSGVSDTELAGLYRGSIALLFPSVVEGFGLPVAEALASGAPVAYWAGCESVAEISGTAGTPVADASDEEAWIAAMDQLVSSRRDIRMPQSWYTQYSWDQVGTVLDSTLQAALRGFSL